MVWETSPPLVLASIIFRLVRALLPLAMLWVSKLIIDGVVAWITRGRGDLAGIWKLVALELSLAIASDVLGTGQHAVRQFAGRPLHESNQRAPDGTRLAAGSGFI